jgi:hypothetical protein
MPDESPSLWEQFDSEVEPWRRGRGILICIAAFYIVAQSLILAASILLGNIERFLIFGVGAVFFWLFFYLVWIGVHWIRWLLGGWNLIIGFCLLIWAWRDMSGIETLSATIALLIGAYLLSPSVYFFATEQRKVIRWHEAVLIAAVCMLVLCSIGAAMIGLWVFRNRCLQEAIEFADVAVQHVYVKPDQDWVLAHATEQSIKNNGHQRLQYFFENTKNLGAVGQISRARGSIRLYFRFPSNFESDAHLISEAKSQNGPVELHFILWNFRNNWEIHRMWWTYLPLP